MSAHLAPYPTPMGLFNQFIARQPETLVIKEKVLSLSGDSFDIKTADGRPIFRVQGNAFSLSGRKGLSDMAGNHLFDIRKRHLTLHTTFYGEAPDGREVFEVKSKFSIGSSKAYGTFVSASGKSETLFMKGDWLDRAADITDESTGQPVATIRRHFFNARELLGGQQTYEVTVAPNVDMAIIAAMCICLDEKRNENKGA